MVKDRLNDLKKRTKNRKSVVIDVPEDKENEEDLRSVFDRANVIGSWIEKIENNLDEIKQLLKYPNSINYHKKETQEKIESLFKNNNTVSQQCITKLKTLENELKNIDNNSAEGRIKNIQHNTLKTRFHKALERNDSEMKRFKEFKRLFGTTITSKNIKITNEEMETLLEGNVDVELFTDNILAETEEAKRQLEDIEERHSQLMKIEQMLIEVRDLFVQMSILVDHQSELLNRIEYQAQIALESVQGADLDLKSARKKKKKSMKLKIIIIAVLVIVLVIILVLLFK